MRAMALIIIVLILSLSAKAYAANPLNDKCYVDGFTEYISKANSIRYAKVKVCCKRSDIVETSQIVAITAANQAYRGMESPFGKRIDEGYCSEGMVRFGQLFYPIEKVVVIKSLFD